MKVIMGAYACEPAQGSEPAVGWNWAHEAVSLGHEVWVVTRRNNRQAIEAFSARHPEAEPHFVYLDLPRPFIWAKRRLGHPGLLAYYYAWQIALAVVAQRLHRRVGFDLAHHVTFVNDWLPSGLCLLPVPFIWGPVGGSTHRLPRSVEIDLPPYARRHEALRSSLQFLFRRLDPFVAITRRRARLILVYTREGLEGFSRRERSRARAIIHIGISSDGPARPAPTSGDGRPSRRIRILTGGRLVHWKGYDLLIEGFAEFIRSEPDVDARIVITGSGPFRPSLEAIAGREGVRHLLDFVGFLPTRDDIVQLMAQTDLYALPTLRDGPPVALLEAMGYGLPVLCLDLGAPSELVPDGAGFKIQPRDRRFIVAEISQVCSWIAAHPEESIEMGRAARRYALEHYGWGKIRSEISRSYADVLARRCDEPT